MRPGAKPGLIASMVAAAVRAAGSCKGPDGGLLRSFQPKVRAGKSFYCLAYSQLTFGLNGISTPAGLSRNSQTC